MHYDDTFIEAVIVIRLKQTFLHEMIQGFGTK